MNGCEGICSDFRNHSILYLSSYFLFQFPKSDSYIHLKHSSLPVALNLFPTPQGLFEQYTPFSNTLYGFKKYTPSPGILLSLALHIPLENHNPNTETTDG